MLLTSRTTLSMWSAALGLQSLVGCADLAGLNDFPEGPGKISHGDRPAGNDAGDAALDGGLAELSDASDGGPPEAGPDDAGPERLAEAGPDGGPLPCSATIIDIAIGPNLSNSLPSFVAWYDDGKFTQGYGDDLTRLVQLADYTVAPGLTVADIVGIAWGGSPAKLYTWYNDGSISIGEPDDLGKYGLSMPLGGGFKSVDRSGIVAIASSPKKKVFYAYYDSGLVGSGDTPEDLTNRWMGEAKPIKMKAINKPQSWSELLGVAREQDNQSHAVFWGSRFMRGVSNELDKHDADTRLQSRCNNPRRRSR